MRLVPPGGDGRVATFKLSDKFGFSTDIEAGPGALSRYFKSLPDFVNLAINLRTFVETTWDDPSVIASHSTFSFNSPVDIGSQGVSLQVSAGLNGELGIFVPATDGDPLFKPDEFGDNIPVPMDTRYVSATIHAALAPGASTELGELQFGFDGESEVKLSYYHPFCLNSDKGTPLVLESIKHTLASFTIPGDLKDIEGMTEGSVATVQQHWRAEVLRDGKSAYGHQSAGLGEPPRSWRPEGERRRFDCRRRRIQVRRRLPGSRPEAARNAVPAGFLPRAGKGLLRERQRQRVAVDAARQQSAAQEFAAGDQCPARGGRERVPRRRSLRVPGLPRSSLRSRAR